MSVKSEAVMLTVSADPVVTMAAIVETGAFCDIKEAGSKPDIIQKIRNILLTGVRFNYVFIYCIFTIFIVRVISLPSWVVSFIVAI